MGNHVIEMTVLTGTGDVIVIDHTSDDWGAWLMSMGDLGIVLNATFRTEPLYAVEETWSLIGSAEAALRSMRGNDAFVVVHDSVMVQRVRRRPLPTEHDYHRDLVRYPFDAYNTGFQALPQLVTSDIDFKVPSFLLNAYIGMISEVTRHVGYPNVVLPGSDHNSHTHIECELFIERKDVLRTLRLLSAWRYDTPGFNNLYGVFVRHVPPDTEDIPLSPFRDVERFGMILFSYLPWTEKHVFNEFLVMTGERLQQEGIDFTYHRGKYAPVDSAPWRLDPDVIERWRSVRTRLDPRNRFRNAFMDLMID